MPILETAIQWTKSEVISSLFFVAFGLAFFAASFGFWQWGKTDMARAYIIPALIAGLLLLAIGLGIFFISQARITSFAEAYNQDAAAFIASEVTRAEKVLNEYRIAVFRVIPFIAAACALLFMFLQTPLWRASLITIIAMMAVIMIIDTNANARLMAYKERLLVERGD